MKRWLYALFSIALLAWALPALAGDVTLQGDPDLLSPADWQFITTSRSDWPFDVHLIVESAGSPAKLRSDAEGAVDGPNVFALAIDPVHHKTIVRFGPGTGIRQGDGDAIAKAGDAHFKGHDFPAGIEAILSRAKASREGTSAVTAQPRGMIVHQGSSGWSTGEWVLFIAILSLVAYGVFRLWKKSREDRERFERALDANRLETADLLARNVDRMTLPETSPGSPALRTQPAARASRGGARGARTSPGPTGIVTQTTVQNVVVNQNDGFAEGMLMGELMSDRRVAPVVVVEESRVPSGGSSSWSSSDDTGGSSSWASDTGTSGTDAGGGSSDWGSSGGDGGDGGSNGGSSDWGSSGGDGGGGDGGGGGGGDGGGGDSSW